MFEDILGGLGRTIGGFIGLGASHGKGGRDELREMVKVWRKLKSPDFDFKELSPPELKIVAEYFPQTYEAWIPEGGPSIPEEGPEGRRAVLENLERLQDISREGLPLSERLAAREAQISMATEADRIQDAIRGQLAARGRLGGGTEAVLRAMSGQQAANMGRGMGADLTQQAIENRYRALLASQGAAENLRGQDLEASSAKSDTINRFNEAVMNLRTQAAEAAMNERVRAQVANQGLRQDVASTNELNRYQTDVGNLERKNALLQQGFGNEVAKATGLGKALGSKAQGKYAEQANIMDLATQLGGGVGKSIGGIFDLAGGGAGGWTGGSTGGYAGAELFQPGYRMKGSPLDDPMFLQSIMG